MSTSPFPRKTWMLAPGDTLRDFVPTGTLLTRKLTLEANAGARGLIGPSLPVPVPKWSEGQPHGYPEDVNADILPFPTAWLDHGVRDAVIDQVIAVAVADWLVTSGWFDEATGTWLDPQAAANAAGFDDDRIVAWLRGETDAELDAFYDALPKCPMYVLSYDSSEHELFSYRAARLATSELITRLTTPQVIEDENFAFSSIFAAELIHLPTAIQTSLDDGDPLPVALVISTIGLALAQREIEVDSALAALLDCLTTAAEWLGATLGDRGEVLPE